MKSTSTLSRIGFFRQVATAQISAIILNLELVASLIIIGSALPYLVLFVHTKSTTSLENDEIYSITHFSSQGIIKTITDYHVPNNHVFYNLLNALTPNAYSFEPLRARIWSFVAMGAYLGIILFDFFRRKQFLEGAIFFQIATVNYELVDLNLKARGYGLLAFCSVVTSLFVLRYLHEPKIRWLVFISGLTIIGVWTIPSYFFFSGSIILLLFIWTQKRAVLVGGIISLLTITGVYLPVWRQLIENANTYADTWGRQFATVNGVFEAIKVYLLHPSVFGVEFGDWAVFLFLFSLAIIPYLIWDRKDITAHGIHLLFLATFLTFTINLILETAPVRTTAFLSLPLALCALILFSQLLRYANIFIRLIICGIIATFFLFHNIQQVNQFQFTPFENWMGVAENIEQTFPEGTKVFVNKGYNNLRVYLDPTFPIVNEFEMEKFLKEHLVFVDGDSGAEKRVESSTLSSTSVEVVVPQIAGGYQKIIF